MLKCCEKMELDPINESMIIDGHAWNIFKCKNCRHLYIRGRGLDPNRKDEVLVRVVLDPKRNRYRTLNKK